MASINYTVPAKQQQIADWMECHQGLDLLTAEFLCGKELQATAEEFKAGYQYWVLATD